MSKINVLPKEVFQLIAAGEVVERPSSVIKEMIENSIDAGATSITVEIKNGGVTYMRITDNGSGIEKEDVPKVFISHATSKIADRDDLASIGTLGFRGEAMASIASVARVELLTKTKGESAGVRYVIQGGEETAFSEAGCPVGTTIVVRDLFYNTPARMKFLKKDVTEANAVSAVVDRIALSHPDISFRFIRDGKQTLLTPGDDSLLNTIYAVCGRDFAAGLLPVHYTLNGVTVDGYITKPTASRGNRAMQYFYINGRLVQSRTCFAAIEQSYKNTIMVGRFPACVLNLTIDPSLVDVNVHPAKTEVRFTNEKIIFDNVLYACKNALEQDASRKEASFSQKLQLQPKDYLKKEAPPEQTSFVQAKPRADFWQNPPAAMVQSPSDTQADTVHSARPVYHKGKSSVAPLTEKTKNLVREMLEQARSAAEELEQQKTEAAVIAPVVTEQNELPKDSGGVVRTQTPVPPEFRLIGEAFKTYIMVEIENDLYLIDKHAAHERILFEQLKKEGSQGSQVLMVPATVRLSKEEYSILLLNLDLLEEAGFAVEDFGEGTVIVRECPSMLGDTDTQAVITEIAGKLLSGKTDILPEKMDWIYHSMSCRGAVKAGDRTSEFEMQRFVEQLLSMPDIKFCPHGRPVMIRISQYEIEKQFGRV